MAEIALAGVAIVSLAATIYANRSDKNKGLVDAAVALHAPYKEEADRLRLQVRCLRECLESYGIDHETECCEDHSH